MNDSLSPLADVLIATFEQTQAPQKEGKIVVNQLVSKVASWYERLRNVMEYREDEIILRASIERILKRRIILLGGDGEKVAQPLIRELIWARYFPEKAFSESTIVEVEEAINLHLYLRDEIITKHGFSENKADKWFYDLLSSKIEHILNPQKEKETIANFMYQVMKDNVRIIDDTEQNRDVQVFIAIRRAFARDDLASLRYHLFTQYFGLFQKSTLEDISARFIEGYQEIQKQLHYLRKDTIYTYVKDKTAVFLILYDLLRIHKGNLREIAHNEEELKASVFAICQTRYNEIAAKVKRALIRSVLFILLTKVFFAFAVEGTYEKMAYGQVIWSSIIINTGIPPLLMIFVGILMKSPSQDNSERILSYVKKLLYEENPAIGTPLEIKKYEEQTRPVLNTIFTALWFLSFLVTFGILIFILSKIGFSVVSQGIFLFFLAVVSFLTFRIGLMSHMYAVEERLGWVTPISDFFFMPIVRVGRHLTEGVSQINIFLFIFDFIIEAPFKGIFGFVEQWFFFLYQKREKLG